MEYGTHTRERRFEPTLIENDMGSTKSTLVRQIEDNRVISPHVRLSPKGAVILTCRYCILRCFIGHDSSLLLIEKPEMES